MSRQTSRVLYSFDSLWYLADTFRVGVAKKEVTMTGGVTMKLLLLLVVLLFVTPVQAQGPAGSSGSVKKSTTGICHAPGSTYYNKTKNFTPFKTLDECLKSGGRLPKR